MKKMMNKPIKFKIKVKLFLSNILVFIGNSNDFLIYIRDIIKENSLYDKIENSIDNYDGLSIEVYSGLYILYMKEKPKKSYHKSILAHEIFHITSYIMSRIDLKLSNDNEEVYAYLNGFITREFYKKLNKNG